MPNGILFALCTIYNFYFYYRELPTLSKHYVTRLLFVEQPLPQAVIGSWLGQHFVRLVKLISV